MIRKRVLQVAVVLLALWLLIPTRDIVSPDWNVLVTDIQGTPISGATVHDDSQQYTLESSETEVLKITDSLGLVHFEERTIRANGVMRLIGVLRNWIRGVHASFGIHTWLIAFKAGYGDPMKLDLFAQNEREGRATGARRQSAHLILQKCAQGYDGFGCTMPSDPEKQVLPFNP